MSWKSRVQPKLDVESMEDRLLLAGDVRVRVDGDTLVITGDSDDNAVLVRQGDRRNSFVVTALDSDTTADGATDLIDRRGRAIAGDVFTARGIKNISIKMGAGDDQVFVAGISESRAFGTRSAGPLRGDLSIDLGAGDDTLSIGVAFAAGVPGGPIDIGDIPGLGDINIEDIFDCIPDGAIDDVTGAVDFDEITLSPDQDIVDPDTGDIIGIDITTPVDIEDIQFDALGAIVTDPVTGAILGLDDEPILLDPDDPTSTITTDDLGFDELADLTGDPTGTLPSGAVITDGALDFGTITIDPSDPGATLLDPVSGLISVITPLNIEDIQFDPETGDVITETDPTSPDFGAVLGPDGLPILLDPTDPTSTITTGDLGFANLEDLLEECFERVPVDPTDPTAGFTIGDFDPADIPEGGVVDENGNVIIDEEGNILDEEGNPIPIVGGAGGFLNIADLIFDETGTVVDVDEDVTAPPTGGGPIGSGTGLPVPNLFTGANGTGALVNAVSVADDLTIKGGSGDDVITISNTYVGDDFELDAGSGDDEVFVITTDDPGKRSLRVRGEAEFELGSGDDTLVIEFADFQRGDFEADGGRGTDAFFIIDTRNGSRRDFDNFEDRLDEDDFDDIFGTSLRRRRR